MKKLIVAAILTAGCYILPEAPRKVLLEEGCKTNDGLAAVLLDNSNLYTPEERLKCATVYHAAKKCVEPAVAVDWLR